MSSVFLKPKKYLVEGSHFLATLAWTLIFAAALSTILSGQTASSSRTWNPNRITSTETSTIPLPKDWFTGGLIFAVALTAALFSSWVIPECALAITDQVLAFKNDPHRPIKEEKTPTSDGGKGSTPDTPENAGSEKQIDEKTKMVKLLINLMLHLENRLLRETIRTEQDFLAKNIQVLEDRRKQLAADLEKAANLPREILQDMLAYEDLLYIPNIEPEIAEQIANLQAQLVRDTSLNNNGSLSEARSKIK